MVGLSHFALATCLIVPEIRGFILSLYFVIFRNREVKNSTKWRNIALILSEVANGLAMASLTFLVLPKMSLFEASIIPYMTLGKGGSAKTAFPKQQTTLLQLDP